MAAQGSKVFQFNTDISRREYARFTLPLLRRLLRSARPFWPALVGFLAFACAETVIYVNIPILLGDLADAFGRLLVDSILGKTVSFAAVTRAALKVGAMLLGSTGASVLAGVCVNGFSSSYAHRLRTELFRACFRQPIAGIDAHTRDGVYGIAAQSVDLLNQSLNLLLEGVAGPLILAVGLFIRLFRIRPEFGWFALLLMPLSLLINLLLTSKEMPFAAAQRQVNTALELKLTRYYNAYAAAAVTGARGRMTRELMQINARHRAASRAARRIESRRDVLNELLTNVSLAAVAVYGAFCLKDETITIGALIGILICVRKLSEPVARTSLLSGAVAGAAAASQRIFPFLDSPAEPTGAETPTAESAELRFEHVSFGYRAGVPAVLSDVSFTIPAAGITRITGVSGAGKSSVIKLLLRLYRPTQGSILLDGRDVELTDLAAYRQAFCLIEQEAALFRRTVAENIAYGMPEATQAQIRAAAEAVGAHGFISALPQGYHTLCGEGGTVLSGGECQLILLARAVLQQKRVLILDEATAFLDPASFAAVRDAVLRLAQTRAVIIISHSDAEEFPGAREIRIENGHVKEE